MASESVELVLSMHPGPDFDLAPLVNDEQAAAWWRELLEARFDPGVQGTMYLPDGELMPYTGLDGLLVAWRAWLERWVSLYSAIEEAIEDGERVIVVHTRRGRPAPGAPELTQRSATVWTVRDGRVVHGDFNVPREQALASVGARA